MSRTAGEMARGGPVTLDDLIALNDEIAALARAGLPLERGLREVGRDVSGNLSRVMLGLSDRMAEGASLAEALAADRDAFPPIYRAVVEAGLRGGRLPAALESLAVFIRGYVDARRMIAMALWYPLIVLVLAYALFVMMVVVVVPRFLAAYESLRVPVTGTMNFLGSLDQTVWYWGPALPLVFIIMLFAWSWSGRASNFRRSGAGTALRVVPWMRSLVAQLEAASFAQVLAMLLEHQVAYPAAIVLAAESTGDPSLANAARAVAGEAERGNVREAERAARPFPPLLRWVLLAGHGQGRTVEALRQIATIYRKRALHQAEKIRVFLPMIFLVGIGMTATLLYGLTLFVPFAQLLRGLALSRP